jgi:hypothetical protein
LVPNGTGNSNKSSHPIPPETAWWKTTFLGEC